MDYPKVTNKNMTFEIGEVKELWRKLKEGAVYKRRIYHPKNIPNHALDCICPLCLYVDYKIFHKNSHISIGGFFLGWLLVATQKEKNGKFYNDWKYVEELLDQIWKNQDLFYERFRNNLYQNGYRNKKRVEEVIEKRIKALEYLNDPDIKIKTLDRARIMAIKKCIGEDKKFLKRVLKFAQEKREFSWRDLEKKLSDKRIKDFVHLFRMYEGELGIFYHQKDKRFVYMGDYRNEPMHVAEKIIQQIKTLLPKG